MMRHIHSILNRTIPFPFRRRSSPALSFIVLCTSRQSCRSRPGPSGSQPAFPMSTSLQSRRMRKGKSCRRRSNLRLFIFRKAVGVTEMNIGGHRRSRPSTTQRRLRRRDAGPEIPEPVHFEHTDQMLNPGEPHPTRMARPLRFSPNGAGTRMLNSLPKYPEFGPHETDGSLPYDRHG